MTLLAMCKTLLRFVNVDFIQLFRSLGMGKSNNFQTYLLGYLETCPNLAMFSSFVEFTSLKINFPNAQILMVNYKLTNLCAAVKKNGAARRISTGTTNQRASKSITSIL